MDYIVVCLTALLVSGLTLFSGFGLGTVLLPAFALFFPLPVAIAATAVVHLANNIFKLLLVGKNAHWPTVLRFSLPAVVTAALGAAALHLFAALPVLSVYSLAGRAYSVTLLGAVVGGLIVGFALLEFSPAFSRLEFPARYMPLGGALSGFFGGLTGSQGVLRTAFLVKAGLGKEAFIGTGVVCAVLVDIARLAVYGLNFYTDSFAQIPPHAWGLVGAATLAAFIGAYTGARLLRKVTMPFIQRLVAVMMITVGLALMAGLV